MTDKVRLDKWLWACRFFKTRSLAKQAIDGGHVQVNGHRAKAGKELAGGELVTFRRGFDRCSVEVLQLESTRRSAKEVSGWYAETPESLAERQKHEAERKIARESYTQPDGRPDKKQRRQIHRFQRIAAGEEP